MGFILSGNALEAGRVDRLCTCAFFLIAFGISLVGRAQTTIHVPADQPTIQAGIGAANNGDTVLVAPGTYTENIDFKGKAITVTSGATSYSGAAATILQPKLTGPIVIFQSGETRNSVFNGFSLQHGNSTAIYMPAGSPTISNNVVTNGYGCGIVARGSNSSPSIQGNHLTANHAVLPVALTYVDCGVPSEPAMGTVNGGALIGLLEAGDAEVIGNLIDNNDLTPDNGTTTSECGAGICGLGAGKVLIESNTIRNNLLNGAAIGVIQSQDLSIVQNLVFGNTVIGSAVEGGSSAQTLALVNNTVYGNTFPTEALYDNTSEQVTIGSVGQAIVENNLFVSSDFRPGMTCGNLPQTAVIAHNDVLNTGLISVPVCPNYGVGSNLAVDPQFIDPTNGDFHTQPTSPVVAVGDYTAPDIPPADLDAKARTVCGTIDMGVYEIRPHPPITLTASPNPVAGGSSVTFTATVTGNCNVPTGLITFLDGAIPIGTATLNTGAIASFSTAGLSVGSHTITATYPGDFNFENSVSNAVVEVVTGYPSATTLNSVAPNPADALQAITFSARVNSTYGTPTGNVTFMAGSTALTTATLNASGVASATVSTLGAGSYAITAVYDASTEFAGSSSNTITETVLGTDTVTTLTASPNPAAPAQTVTFTGQVAVASGTGTPSGNVTFTDGGARLETAVVSATGTATFSTAALAAGTHQIVATFNPTGNYAGSTSAAVAEQITNYDFALTVSSTSLTLPTNSSQVLTVTLTPSGGFPRAVNLTCAPVPQYAECAFSQATSAPLSGGPQSLKLTVSTSAVLGAAQQVARLNQRKGPSSALAAALWPGILVTGLAGGRSRRFNRKLRQVLLLAGITASVVSLQGCVNQWIPVTGTAPGNYVITVTASDSDSSSGLTHSVNLNLTVTP
jgi:parallel beta-helix repeat protein